MKKNRPIAQDKQAHSGTFCAKQSPDQVGAKVLKK
jgi:hypothetical protein